MFREDSFYSKTINILPAFIVLFVSGFFEIFLVFMNCYSTMRLKNWYFYILHIFLIIFYILFGRNVLCKVISYSSKIIVINTMIVFCFLLLFSIQFSFNSINSIMFNILYLIEIILLCISIKYSKM